MLSLSTSCRMLSLGVTPMITQSALATAAGLAGWAVLPPVLVAGLVVRGGVLRGVVAQPANRAHSSRAGVRYRIMVIRVRQRERQSRILAVKAKAAGTWRQARAQSL